MKTNAKAMYVQLYDKIVKQIVTGEMQDGEKLPTERKMCEIYGVSRITVRQALELLERDAYVERIQGSGTYIRKKGIEHKLTKLYTLRDEFVKKGITHRKEIKSFDKMEIHGELCKILNVEEGQEVYHLVRVFFADDKPYTVETTYLPLHVVGEGLSELAIEENGLYNTLADCGICPTTAKESLSIRYADKASAKLLELNSELVCMQIARTTYHGNEVMEYTVNLVRRDSFVYTVEFSAQSNQG